MALSAQFHEKVLLADPFQDNVICLGIDESHCISEWGTDDFRPEFSRISKLIARMPSGVPILAASSTMPRDVITDIQHKLGLPQDCARIAVSNEKPNIALSVRILQQHYSSNRIPSPTFFLSFARTLLAQRTSSRPFST